MPLWSETGHMSDIERVSEARRLVTEILPFTDKLSAKNAEFIQKFHDRFEQYGDGTFVSAKQLFWLRDIYETVL
jgi:hypothetical protein